MAGKILEDLTLRKSLAINEAGKLARERIERLTKEIGGLIRQAEKISIQIDYGRKGELEEAIKKEQEETKKVIERTLAQTGGDKTAAAALLGIGRRTIYRYLGP